MESQNAEQLKQENSNELSDNLDLSEAIAVNENQSIPENSNLEPSVDEFNNGTVAQQLAGLQSKRTQKTACWSEDLQKWVDCPPRP